MPTTQLQLRRGTSAQTAIFTGAVGEVTVDTDKKTLIVHDGVTVGGTEIALKSRLDSSYEVANSAFVKSNTLTSIFYSNTITYSTTSSNQILDSYSSTQFRTSKYTIQSETQNDIHSSEILISHDGSSVFLLELANVKSGSNLFSLDTSLSSNVVSLLITPVNSNTVVDFVRTSIPKRLSIEGLGGDLTSQYGIVDLNTSAGVVDLNA